MAQLTEEIGGVQNRIPVRDPGPRGPSFLSGLASLVQTGTGVVGGLQEGARRNAERAAQQHEAETAALDDELAGAFLDDRTREAGALPRGIEDAAQNLARLQLGSEQGSVSRSRVSTETESTVQRLFREYPEQRAEILDRLAETGADHYLFREASFNAAAEAAEQESLRAATTAAYEYGVSRLPPELIEEYEYNQVANIGAALRADQFELEQAREAAAEARARAGENRAQSAEERARVAYAQAQRDRLEYRVAVRSMATTVGPAVEQFMSDLSNAANAEGRNVVLRRTDELVALIESAVNNQVQEAVAANAGAAAVSNIRTHGNEYIQTIQSLVGGDDFSILGLQQRMEEGLIQETRLSVIEEIEGLRRLIAIVQPNNAAGFLMQTEVSRFLENGVLEGFEDFARGDSTPASDAFVRDIQSFGQTNLATATPRLLEMFGTTYVQRLQNVTQLVNSGRTEVVERHMAPWRNDFSGAVELADREFTRGQAQPEAFEPLSRHVFNNNTAEALNLSGDPALKTRAETVARRMISEWENLVPPQLLGQGVERFVSYSEANGRFESRAPGNTSVAATPIEPFISGQVTSTRTVSPDPQRGRHAEQMANSLNSILDFLVTVEGGNTSGNRELRNQFVLGATDNEGNE